MSDDPRDHRNEGDAERDAWLREALRHAPDAATGAPSFVRDAILRQAREAAAVAPTTDETAAHKPRAYRSAKRGRHDAWASWWSWLMQPSVAAGFASVMVATLVGVMWWGRPIDEPLREASLPDSHAPAAATSVAPAASPTPPPAAAPTAPPFAAPAAPAAAPTIAPPAPAAPALPRAELPARPAPPPATTRTDAARLKAAPREARSMEDRAAQIEERRSTRPLAEAVPSRELSARESTTAAPPPPGSAATTPAATAPAVERKREAESASELARPVGRGAAAEADMAAAPAEMPAAKAAPSPFPGQAGTAAPAAAERAPAPKRGADPAAEVAAANLARAAGQAPKLAPDANPVARLRSTVEAAPDAWSWQRDGDAEQPMNDAVRAWLGRLDDATRARWQVASESTGSAAQTLRLLHNGRLHTTLHIEAGATRLEATAHVGAGSVLRAALPAATAAALAAELDQATR